MHAPTGGMRWVNTPQRWIQRSRGTVASAKASRGYYWMPPVGDGAGPLIAAREGATSNRSGEHSLSHQGVLFLGCDMGLQRRSYAYAALRLDGFSRSADW